MSEAKPYDISEQLVWEAYQRVKANRGAAGVDGVSLAAFEKDLKGNLYKVWNRMSSGWDYPPPVRLVEIPKDNGGTLLLGIPTIADRVAQTVVKMVLEPLVQLAVPSGLLRLSTRPFCARRSRDGAETLLGDRLGYKTGHPERLQFPFRTTSSNAPCGATRIWLGFVSTLDGGCAPLSNVRTERSWSGGGEPRKAVSLVRCWPICSCTMHSIGGWIGTTRASASSVMRTMLSSTAGARRKLDRCWKPSAVASQNAAWSFIQRRPGSCPARKMAGRGATNISSSTSSATPFNLDARRIAGKSIYSASCRRSATRPPRRSGRPFASGEWRPPGTTSVWRIWLA